MTELRIEPYIIPGGDLGPENPLPIFRNEKADRDLDFDAHNIPEEDRPGLGWQTGFRVLPYRMQDNYNRRRQPRKFLSVVLENEYLRVTVLPQIGGLVTEIFHKGSGKQLIARNNIFQPGNLALRNAWVFGGIEWNTGQLGHHYLTMSPLHTARIRGIKGAPALRLYAWDRVKCFPYQIDLHLPDKSEFLFARIRIINPHNHILPMYWWTNIGVNQYKGTRVLAPAETAFQFTEFVEVPIINGIDFSYPSNVDHSYDLFFRIPHERRKWIAVVDNDGTGMVHTSTGQLLGRKVFGWGTGPGGTRWQEYLCGSGQSFFEVQAGLARNQLHSVPMPAGAQWTWTEALGRITTEPERAHGEWNNAWREVEACLERVLPAAEVERFDTEFAKTTHAVPEKLICRGLGWGALENCRAAMNNENSGIPDELPFTEEDLGPEQEPWLRLMKDGALPPRHPQEDTGEYMIQNSWREILENSIRTGKGDHWLSWLHLGVMLLENGETDNARQAWRKSIDICPSGWAYRNLAALALRENDQDEALACFNMAWEIGPRIAPLALEIMPVMNKLKAWEPLRVFLRDLPAELQEHERVLIEKAQQALRDDKLEELKTLLNREYDTIREGETILTDLWFAMCEKQVAEAEGVLIDDKLKQRIRDEFPPPSQIDFRMWTRDRDRYVAPQAAPQEAATKP